MTSHRGHVGSAHLAPESVAVLRRFVDQHNERNAADGTKGMDMRVDGAGNVHMGPVSHGSLTVNPGSDGSTLMWKSARGDGAPIAAYKVYRDGKLIATVKDATWFKDASGDPSQPHDYDVRPVDAAGLEGFGLKLPMRTMAMQQAGTGAAQAGAQHGSAPAAGTPSAGTTGGAPAAGSANPAAGTPTGATPATGAMPKGGSPPAAAPSASSPIKLSIAKVDDSTFNLTWAPVQGAAKYGVYQDGKLIGIVDKPQFGGKVAKGSVMTISIDAIAADGSRSAPALPVIIRVGDKGLEAAALTEQQMQQIMQQAQAQAQGGTAAAGAPAAGASQPTAPAAAAPAAAAPAAAAPASAAPAAAAPAST